MQTWINYIAPSFFLVWILFGLIATAFASFFLRRARGAAGAAPGGRRVTAWKWSRTVGILLILPGLFGFWRTQPSLGLSFGPPQVWSDGRAPELAALVRARCVPFVDEKKAAGLAVALVSPTDATVLGCGETALAFGSPVRGDTVFEIGSITKTFTGILLARAIEEGGVRLDQPIHELLPPGVDLPVEARGVTLRHLVTHTSGFPRLPQTLAPSKAMKMPFLGSDPYAGLTEGDYWEAVRSVDLDSVPGQRVGYSNFGTGLMGLLLAREAGLDLEAVYRREIFEPLGMAGTAVRAGKLELPRAQGYRASLGWGPVAVGLRADPWLSSANLSGFGGIHSTGNDMLKYLLANMRPQGLPVESALRTSHGELFRDNEKQAFGMAWVRSRFREIEPTVIWHNGQTGGFSSFLGFTEDGRFGVVVLANGKEIVDRLGGDLLRDVVARLDGVG